MTAVPPIFARKKIAPRCPLTRETAPLEVLFGGAARGGIPHRACKGAFSLRLPLSARARLVRLFRLIAFLRSIIRARLPLVKRFLRFPGQTFPSAARPPPRRKKKDPRGFLPAAGLGKVLVQSAKRKVYASSP